MGLLSRVLAPERRTYSADDDFWYTAAGGTQTAAGVQVSTDKAMRCATVFACVRILSESIGSVPCKLYRRLDNGGKELAIDHPLYSLVHDAPNADMSAMTFFETAMAHLTTQGNAYCPKTVNRKGAVVGLDLLSPMRVEIDRAKNGRPIYKVRNDDGQPAVFTDEEMVHIPGLAWDGLRGLSPIEYMRESIGLALATEEFGARYFSNGTNAGAILTLPDGMRQDNEQTKKFIEDFKRSYAGLGKSHNFLAVPAGMTYSNIGVPPDQAQFLETRRYQKADIASIFRVPLHLIQEHEKSTSWGTGIYQMTLGFVQYTLRPWAVRIEQALNRQLLGDSERGRYFFEFNLDALLRGDLDKQGAYFMTAIQNGWLSRNEVREIINKNPVDGGDEYLVPMNMTIAGAEPPPAAPPAPAQEPPQRSACDCGHDHAPALPREAREIEKRSNRPAVERSYIRVIRDAMQRVIRRERNDILQSAGKLLRSRGTGDLERFIEEFYTGHQEFTLEQITPAFTALAEAVGASALREINQEWDWTPELQDWLEGYIRSFVARHSARSRQQLLDLIAAAIAEGEDVLEALTVRFDEWDTGVAAGSANRAEKIAAENSVRLGEGFAREAFFAAGVTSLIWVAVGSETCPYCRELDGRVVGREGSFLAGGEAFAPGGADPLVPSFNVMHPPAHAGCDCFVVPGV